VSVDLEVSAADTGSGSPEDPAEPAASEPVPV